MLFWRKKKKKPLEAKKTEAPEDAWVKCSCGEVYYRAQLDRHWWVCPKCGAHMRIPARKFVEYLLDDGRFSQEIAPNLVPTDPINFPEYKEKVKRDQKKTGEKEAAIAGLGEMGGHRVVLFVTDFAFLGGSMGSVVGEKFLRSARKAVELRRPLIAVTASGGGARMHEGIISLMQMVKTTVGCIDLDIAKVPYINVLSDPTMAGVMASFASLGDILIAEPGALLGFTGPRVIQQTIGVDLPEGFETSEFQLEHGQIDMVVPRPKLRETLIRILDVLEGIPPDRKKEAARA
jgi:acetyl-CoA carboxylase carboxyl transferase subunit beta